MGRAVKAESMARVGQLQESSGPIRGGPVIEGDVLSSVEVPRRMSLLSPPSHSPATHIDPLPLAS